jgi:hypothetical protein
MKKIYLFFALLSLMIIGCSSINTKYDYDPEFDFSKLKKFRFATDEESSKKDLLAQNPLLKKRIQMAVKDVLQQKGFEFVEGGGADFVVNLMAGTEEKTQVSSSPNVYYGWGYGYWGGYYGGSNVTVTNYTEGTLLVDIIDTGKNQLVWRGILQDVIDNTATTHEEKMEYITHIVTEVLQDFPPPSQEK